MRLTSWARDVSGGVGFGVLGMELRKFIQRGAGEPLGVMGLPDADDGDVGGVVGGGANATHSSLHFIDSAPGSVPGRAAARTLSISARIDSVLSRAKSTVALSAHVGGSLRSGGAIPRAPFMATGSVRGGWPLRRICT